MSSIHFTFLDYILFCIVFIVSMAIGLYFAYRSKDLKSVDEYFFGTKKLGVLPVAFSLLATALSGSSTIGQSMEVYAYGLHNFMYTLLVPVWGFLVHTIFLPIFYDLQLKSSFAYLELRFDKSVKIIASGLYVITGFFLIPMTIYVPALSFQEVTGLNLYLICTISGCLCICYTVIGGFKAVVWTDVFQFSLILLSTLIILCVGLVSVGGFQNTWDAVKRGGRLDVFKTDFNLEARGSLWAYLFSNVFLMTYNIGITQSSMQRFLALPTLLKAKQALWIQCFFCALILILHYIIGAVIYATYEDCDPLSAGIVRKIDQIFPHFVQEKATLFLGFNGIFIAGVFAAGLSTTSTLLNTVSGIIYVDFLSNRMLNASQKNKSKIMKIIVAIVGVIGIGLIFIIERLGTIFVITIQCFTISTVGVFGLFCNGMIFKNINSKGTKCGVIVAMVTVAILIGGSLRKNPDPVLPLRIDGCDFVNATNPIKAVLIQNSTKSNLNDDLPWIFRINFQFFCIIGLIINIVIGSLVSLLTGGNNVDDQRLFASFLRKKPLKISHEENFLLAGK